MCPSAPTCEGTRPVDVGDKLAEVVVGKRVHVEQGSALVGKSRLVGGRLVAPSFNAREAHRGSTGLGDPAERLLTLADIL